MRTGEWYSPENLLIELMEDDHGSQELIATTVLLETDILAEMAVPDLALMKEES